MQGNVNVAIVGLGGMGQAHTRDLLAWDDAPCKIVAGIDTSETRRNAYRDTFCVPVYTYLYQQPVDAVIVCTPHAAHYCNVLHALEMGAHVLCEKPLAITSQEAEKMLMYPRMRLATCQHLRADGLWRAMRSLYQAGSIGELREVRLKCLHNQLAMYQDKANWRARITESGGGILIDTGNHLTDALFWILGEGPQQVDATIERFGCEVDILTTVACQWPTGATGQMVFNAQADGVDEMLEIVGSVGMLSYSNGACELVQRCGSDFLLNRTVQREEQGNSPARNFILAILGREALQAPADLTVARFVDKVYRSAGENL
ncbi:MAG: Gfo/Idh/MocA family oxidoreductase [Nitrospinae bacterium]|nr:Gfo/Idh/MocA family oxidoreductase [Nitrospinota bacterium]